MDALPILTSEMVIVMIIVVFAVFIFATELLRVDVAALLIMTLLGLLIFVPGFEQLLTPDVLFSGFSSNAVISIIAVMILGGGLDKTGVMERVAWAILRYGGKTEKKIVSLISSSVAVISSFMQNVGAAALYLPVVSRISSRTRLPMSRLVMPMGFCAILGGTMTMVASSPLIMLNDLIDRADGDVERGEMGGDVRMVHPAGDLHAMGDAELGSQCFHLADARSVADDQHPGVGGCTRCDGA